MLQRKWASLAMMVAVLGVCGTAVAQTGGKTGTTSGKPAAKAPKPSVEKASTVTLKVGDAPPELKVQKWIKGAPLESFEPGKGYVVEFWATWCPPCRESIPKLTKLAKAHKNVRFIGIAASEREETPQLAREVVEGFVKRQGKAMAYTVGYTSDRLVNKHWMGAAGVTGIPSAFVIDAKGKIIWIGNPLDGQFDRVVADLSASLGKTEAKPSKPEEGDDDGDEKGAPAQDKPAGTPQGTPETSGTPKPASAPEAGKPSESAPANSEKPKQPGH